MRKFIPLVMLMTNSVTSPVLETALMRRVEGASKHLCLPVLVR